MSRRVFFLMVALLLAAACLPAFVKANAPTPIASTNRPLTAAEAFREVPVPDTGDCIGHDGGPLSGSDTIIGHLDPRFLDAIFGGKPFPPEGYVRQVEPLWVHIEWFRTTRYLFGKTKVERLQSLLQPGDYAITNVQQYGHTWRFSKEKCTKEDVRKHIDAHVMRLALMGETAYIADTQQAVSYLGLTPKVQTTPTPR